MNLRRIIPRVSVLLILGAIVNVAVAWGLATVTQFWRSEVLIVNLEAALASVPNRSHWEQRTLPDGTWQLIHQSGIPPENPAIRTSRGRWFAIRTVLSPDSALTCIQTGWPALGMSASIEQSKLIRTQNLRAMMLLRNPLWPGFAINTIFYTGILWMLFAAPFAARRTIRRRRGRCITCNYDLRGQPAANPKGSCICPECGANASATMAPTHRYQSTRA